MGSVVEHHMEHIRSTGRGDPAGTLICRNDLEPDNRNARYGMGLILIIAGVLLLFLRRWTWTIFGEGLVLTAGIAFLLLRLIGRVHWAVFPGAFATTTGAVILLDSLGLNMDIFWPLFVIAPGVAFFLIRALEPRHRWAAIPGSIVTVVGLSMFAISTKLFDGVWDLVGQWWPLVLVALGITILLGPRRRNE